MTNISEKCIYKLTNEVRHDITIPDLTCESEYLTYESDHMTYKFKTSCNELYSETIKFEDDTTSSNPYFQLYDYNYCPYCGKELICVTKYSI